MKKIAFIDIDDVCALLSEVWYARYNKDYNDDLTVNKVTDWNTHLFVKPECGLDIYKYIADPTLYDEVRPREGALEGVQELRRAGYRVVFATSSPIPAAGRKFYWLKEHGFEPKEKDYVELQDKSLLKGDIIFDDRYDNVANFDGRGYLLTRPWNAKKYWNRRASDWAEFIGKLKLYDSHYA